MSSRSFEEVEGLFHACAALPTSERASFLEARCPDPKVRAQVLRLLRADDRAVDFLEPPRAEDVRETLPDPDLELGCRLGAWRIIRRIGAGGMGTVYLGARADLEFEQTVAIKIVRAGLRTPDSLASFRLERQTLARLNHPNIARLLDGGTRDDGTPWLVMEYVEGVPIDVFCKSHSLDVEARLAIFERVLEAVDFAHTNLVIHRDLKPSNILVTSDGVAKLLDFGVSEVFCQDGVAEEDRKNRALTPGYASPEQEAGIPLTTASDVYSLGVILHSLLTDSRPQPRTKARAARTLGRDLDAILAKMLSKDPAARYLSVREVIDDLDRRRRRQPLRAREPTTLYVASLFFARHARSTLFAVVLALLLVFWIADSIQKGRQDRERLAEMMRLADLHRLDALVARAAEPPPPSPTSVPELERWVAEAEQLAARLVMHRATLASWRNDAPDPGGSDLAFESAEYQWRHDMQANLVARLDAFVAAEAGTLARMRARLDDARTIFARSVDDYATEWDEAIEAIAASPLYGGLELAPQVGLVPLGSNEQGYFEFAHLPTGTIPGSVDQRLEIEEDTALVFVLLPAGSYVTGGKPHTHGTTPNEPNVDAKALDNESPLMTSEVAAFFISKYEMTQGQWRRATGANPSVYVKGTTLRGPYTFDETHPVESVSWGDADRVLRGLGLSLPSEAQWEYAARAGTHTPWWTGDNSETLKGAANVLDLSVAKKGIEWANEGRPVPFDDGHVVHAPVDAFRPNPFGLHSTAGNVMEWCLDPLGAKHDQSGVYRGGSFNYPATYARSSFRSGATKEFRAATIGVRPVRAITPESATAVGK